jgi:uncharacterized membrane protein YdjX (TVP38/TMEM64 family)
VPPQSSSARRPRPSSGPQLSRIVATVLAVAAVYWLGRSAGGHVAHFSLWVEGLGAWGPAVFVAGYVVATVAFVPGVLLTLAAGALFGLVRGTLYVMLAATLGACAAFAVGRHLARDWVARRLAANPRFRAIDRAVERNGLKVVFLLRLSPAFPFNALNYALGLTAVGFRDYALGCAGMLPGTLLYVYYGKLAGDVASAAAGTSERGPFGYALLALGLAATVAVTALLTRAARDALRETEIET